MTRTLGSFSVVVLVLSLAGCGKDEACTRARHQGADAWKGVYQSAGKLKLNGGTPFEDLDKNKQAEHTKALEAVETQSEMVFKSFAYEKITWGTAGPAREKANAAWDGFFNQAAYPTFAGSLKTANAEFDAVKTACGEN